MDCGIVMQNVYCQTFRCRPCYRLRSLERLKELNKNPDYKKMKSAKNKFRRYKLTEEDTLKLLENQGFKCAICEEKLDMIGRKTHIDHDHITGKIRGVLCSKCNLGLGYFKDSIEFLKSAVVYLQEVDKNNA